MLRRLLASTLAAVAATSLLLTAHPALACGGFFCDAITLSPIYQAGERILFSRDDTTVTMHIEIVYQGDPTSFGWVLPLAELPTGPNGEELPLNELVQISSQDLFDTLQNNTDPTFARNITFDNEDPCAGDREFANGGTAMAAAPSVAEMADSEAGAAVTVLQEAKVGPYDAQLIEVNEDVENKGAELFKWLDENGYYQDPNSEPLLDEYGTKGFKFLGIKLQNGQDAGDIKPIALTMSELAPCVPLKLTSIAATPEMPILVWVLGEGRAVPKNFIHAVVNEQALTYPGAQNYIDVVTAAVDTVEGRAWVTEYAQPSSNFQGMMLDPRAEDMSGVFAAESISGVLNAMASVGYSWRNEDVEDVLRNYLTKPEGLTGYPWNDCYWNGWSPDLLCDPDETHVTTNEEFFGALDYWIQQTAVAEHFNTMVAEDTTLLADLKNALNNDVIEVRKRLQALFDKEGTTLTRFFTTLDPDEMTRDPIFSFNPDLPNVELDRSAEMNVWYDDECDPWGTMEYPDGSRYTFDCNEVDCFGFGGTVGPVPGAPALKWAQILEETGLPRIFDPTTAPQVDEVLEQTTASSSTLPEQFVLAEIETPEDPANSWPNPPEGHPAVFETDDGGCNTTGSSTSWWMGLVLVLTLGVFRRRELITER